jgi:FkbM family methyltransferase
MQFSRLRRILQLSPLELALRLVARSKLLDTRAQLGQDIWVLLKTRFKRNGFFVDIGASDPEYLSNTWLLEHRFGWSGIVAEPDPRNHSALIERRPHSRLCKDCVAATSGRKGEFLQAAESVISTMAAYEGYGHHAPYRENSKRLELVTISLNDLLDSFCAPPEIDYMSIDTEGSETEILSSFDFTKRRISHISVEHNELQERQIDALLQSRGYRRECPTHGTAR